MRGLNDVQTLRARVEGKQQNVDIVTLLELSEIALRGEGRRSWGAGGRSWGKEVQKESGGGEGEMEGEKGADVL